MTNANGPSGSGYYISLTTPTLQLGRVQGAVRISTHGLIHNRSLEYADYATALAIARKWARELDFYINDYVRRRHNGEPRTYRP